MKSAKILYFSGTGNSRYVAERIASAFDTVAEYLPDIFKTCTSINAAIVGSATAGTGNCSELLIIVAPTYAYRLPLFIDEGLRRLTFAKGTAAYFVLTCGAGVGAAGKYNRSLAQACGLDYRGTAGVVMPENYLAMFTPPSKERACEIIRKAGPRIDEIIGVIKSFGTFTDKSGPVGAFESGPVNRIFFSRIIKDAKFRVAGQCSGCGACARLCPLGNISITDGHPVWNGSCTHCMRCICCCPNEAIEYGRSTVKKRKYHFDKN